MPAQPSLGLELGFASGAASDALGGTLTDGLSVDFGDKNSGGAGSVAPAGATAGGSMFTGLIRDLAVGVAVALAAKWAWGQIK